MAGFLDRAKESAQRALHEGRDKVDELQAKRSGHELVRRLGAAYYAEQREGGTPEAVQQALRAVDEHVREHGDSALRG